MFRFSNLRRRLLSKLIVPADGELVAIGTNNEHLMPILKQVRQFTMVSDLRLLNNLAAVDHVVRNSIAGAIVECGVWRGGSAMAMALRLAQLNDTKRKIWLFDTFSGMPRPGEFDTKDGKQKALSTFEKLAVSDDASDWCYADEQDVRKNMFSTDINRENVVFVKGKVEDTIPKSCPEKISLLRLDTDWYLSTKHCLENLFPRLSKGGILIIDDYGSWDGAKRAVDEYFDYHQDFQRPTLFKIDNAGHFLVKL